MGSPIGCLWVRVTAIDQLAWQFTTLVKGIHMNLRQIALMRELDRELRRELMTVREQQSKVKSYVVVNRHVLFALRLLSLLALTLLSLMFFFPHR
jgi:hypothetical protein